MDSYHRIIAFVVILVTHRGNCSDLTATFANGAFDVSCTSPPSLTFHSYGYIQCQQACIRHSNCAWIRYVKDHLTCSFYLDGHCAPGAVGNITYLKKTEIEEKIGGYCRKYDCPPDTVCANIHDGTHICIPDKEMTYTPEEDQKVSFVHFDGLVFKLFRKWSHRSNAALTCGSSSGHLAVVDTPRKQQILVTALLDITTSQYWWVGGAYNSTDDLIWYPEVTPAISSSFCVRFPHGGGALQGKCDDWFYFVCELG